jgi:hypothetical protein
MAKGCKNATKLDLALAKSRSLFMEVKFGRARFLNDCKMVKGDYLKVEETWNSV